MLGNRPCPRCKTPLREAREGDVTVDRCGVCRGAWYDRGELEGILKRSAPAEPVDLGRARREIGLAREGPSPDPGYLTCPVCAGLMNRRNFGTFSGVLVDVCRDGIWLDGGELEKLTAFAAKGGLEVASDADRRDEVERQRTHADMMADADRFAASRSRFWHASRTVRLPHFF